MDEEALHKLSAKYNLKISNIFHNSIIVRSKWDEWMLEWDFGEWLRLRHRNTKYDTEKFHTQRHKDKKQIKFKTSELKDAFEYIKGHDKYMDERRGGEKRIKVMFRKIATDNY